MNYYKITALSIFFLILIGFISCVIFLIYYLFWGKLEWINLAGILSLWVVCFMFMLKISKIEEEN